MNGASKTIVPRENDDRQLMLASAAVALAVELLVLTVFGWSGHWLAHPQDTGDNSPNFIEAQIFELPPEAHLVEAMKPVAPVKPEATLSKKPDQGREAKTDEKKVQDENQTDSGAQLAPTHGPVASVLAAVRS